MADKNVHIHATPKALARYRNDEGGATAIEFAIVATPFLMFVFGLIGIALHFFILSSVEKGMDQASRLIRTGQTDGMTVNDFKQAVADNAGVWVKDDKLQVFVTTYPTWADVVESACVNGDGSVAINTVPGTQPIAQSAGGAEDIVVVTSCYKWELAAHIPFLHLGNLADGSMMMQSSTAFRSEPYESN